MNKPNQVPHLFKPLLRGLPVVVLCVLAGVLAAGRYLHYATPMYESTAKIRMADTKDGVPNNNLYKDFDVFTSTNKIGTEVEMLKSGVLIGKVVSALDMHYKIFRVGDLHKKELYRESPLLIQAAQLPRQYLDRPLNIIIARQPGYSLTFPDGKSINGKLGQPLSLPGGQITISLNQPLLSQKAHLQIADHYELIVQSEKSMTEEILHGLDVMSVDKDIPVLRISYKCPVAEKCADVVNAIAKTYITDYIEEKYRSADTTDQFLTRQLLEYSDKLKHSEADIQGYRDARNIVNIHQETETDLRKIADLKKQLASVQMNLEAVDSLNQYIHRNRADLADLAPNFEAFNDLLSTEIVKDIKHLQAEKKDLLTRFTAENDKVKVVDDKIDNLSDYLEESINNTAGNLRIKYRNLSHTINAAESVFTGLPEKERTLTVLERNFSLNEQIYRFLQEKKTDAEIAKAATLSFHRIISDGEIPQQPVSPNRKLIMGFSGLLALLFGIGGIYGVHFMKGRVDHEQTVYSHSDTPLAYLIPFCNQTRMQQQLFRRWVMALDVQGKLMQGTLLAISSVRSGEGKSFIANGLADAAAYYGKKVLLLSLNKTTNTDRPFDVMHSKDLPAGWYTTDGWSKLTGTWKKVYDLIIICNDQMETTTSILTMSTADLNYCILDSRITRVNDLLLADDLKMRLGLEHNMAFVLNRDGYTPGLLQTFTRRLLKRKK